MNFAESYEPVARGAVRPVSGLLLYGPPGTGKSSGAQAIAHYLKGTFYSFSAADLSNGKAGAVRIDALFDVAMAGELPAIIFIDEVDTILSARAQSRVGHFAGRFSRFTDNLLVIGATNNPELIAEKILTGRFERKILIDTPDADARRSLLLRQLSQDDQPHALQSHDILNIVAKTALSARCSCRGCSRGLHSPKTVGFLLRGRLNPSASRQRGGHMSLTTS